LENHHLMDVWRDDKMDLGRPWDDDIKQAMSNSLLAVILLTKEALKSDYILTTEFPALRALQQNDKLLVIPVICEPCNWRSHAWLKASQAPNGSRPLSGLSDAERDRVFRQLASTIAKQVSRMALEDLVPPKGWFDGLRALVLPRQDQADLGVRVYLDKFPLNRGSRQREEKLIGREQELALLDLALAQPHTAIVTLVAWGGVGKSMLVRCWLEALRRNGWFGMRRVYAWSFYSQGTKEDRQASEEPFLAHALEWFGVHCGPTLSPREKGRLLADAIARNGTLLILDGIEPLQNAAGPAGGELRADGVRSLLKELAHRTNASEHSGLCLVTTRVPLADLARFQRRPGAAWGSVLRVDLGNLSEEAGAALLHHGGAKRAGRSNIQPDDPELMKASLQVGSHALTLSLLGRFLARAHGGDILCRDRVRFEEADRNEQGGTTFKMLAGFERWFADSGDMEQRSLAVLRLLGLFDRPADAGCIADLRDPPAITGLTDRFFMNANAATGRMARPLPDESFNTAVSFLVDLGLAAIPAEGEWSLDCHPLIREYFAKRVSESDARAWKTAHQRVYDHLESSAVYQPETLLDLQPLYQSVTHACHAGMYPKALDLLRGRIQRNGQYFSTYQLGATASDLQAFASFFTRFPNPATLPVDCSAQDKAFILRQVGYSLRARGSLEDAEATYRQAVTLADQGPVPDWEQAATAAQLLGEVLLLHGRVKAACDAMETAVHLAKEHLDDGYRLRINLTFLGTALMQAGSREKARLAFERAEGVAQHRAGQPQRLTLGNLFRFGEWLVNEGELNKAAALLEQAEALEAVDSHKGLFSDGLHQLLLGMIAAQRARSGERVSTNPNVHFGNAYDNFVKAGRDDFRARALIEWASARDRGWQADEAVQRLNEAREIAERGPMGLHLADIHLRRAYLFCEKKLYPWPSSAKGDLAAAEKLINECGYHRRDKELEDTEKAILSL
jgi:tetratricopeptide (TPR) repeat protein